MEKRLRVPPRVALRVLVQASPDPLQSFRPQELWRDSLVQELPQV